MPWVRFDQDFDFKPRAAVTIAYPAGHIGLVPRKCAEAVKAAGKGVETRRPSAPGQHGDGANG